MAAAVLSAAGMYLRFSPPHGDLRPTALEKWRLFSQMLGVVAALIGVEFVFLIHSR